MKRALAMLGVAVLGSQAGHLIAYELRFGAAAQQVQSTSAHAYFPLLAKTVLGAAAMLLIAALLIVGFARLSTGRKIERESAPSLLRLLAGLYTLQLAFFLAQETIEGSPAGELLMWGLLGQLPVAFAGAVALRWLLARLGPALARITASYEPALRLAPYAVALVVRPVAVEAVQGIDVPAGLYTRRGPPSF